jgi:hypothetical protein
VDRLRLLADVLKGYDDDKEIATQDPRVPEAAIRSLEQANPGLRMYLHALCEEEEVKRTAKFATEAGATEVADGLADHVKAAEAAREALDPATRPQRDIDRRLFWPSEKVLKPYLKAVKALMASLDGTGRHSVPRA